MEPDKGKEEHDEAQQENALLTNELERYKKKEKHFAKDKTIESEYCKKIKLLNDEISNLKSQACQKDKTFAREIEKFDEYVQPLLKRKNELEKKNQEFLKKINDLDNRLRKARQTDQTLRMLLPKEDNQNPPRENVGITSSFEDNVKRIGRNQLSDEFEPLVKNVNLQLNCFEKGLVKEMKDDLKYVMSLEDEFDETCLILDIQQEFFKTQFESAISESHSHVYENEMSEQNSSLENEKRFLKNIITELSKHIADVKEEMTKQCAQYEKDFAKLEAHCISLELKSKNKSSTSVQNGQVFSNKSDEAKIKFDTEDLESINIELEYSVASLLKENEHLKRFKTCLIQSNVHEFRQEVQTFLKTKQKI
ncbi:hypothetical protein Tco_1207390 [Tanacetum coccineum]